MSAGVPVYYRVVPVSRILSRLRSRRRYIIPVAVPCIPYPVYNPVYYPVYPVYDRVVNIFIFFKFSLYPYTWKIFIILYISFCKLSRIADKTESKQRQRTAG